MTTLNPADAPLEPIAAAALHRAMLDYRYPGRSQLYTTPEVIRADIERFLRSGWCETLCDMAGIKPHDYRGWFVKMRMRIYKGEKQ